MRNQKLIFMLFWVWLISGLLFWEWLIVLGVAYKLAFLLITKRRVEKQRSDMT